MSIHEPIDLTEAEFAEEMRTVVWLRVVPPIWWSAVNDYVVADGFIGDRRAHMVKGPAPAGLVVANAYVVSQADWPNARFSKELSHLSGSGTNGVVKTT